MNGENGQLSWPDWTLTGRAPERGGVLGRSETCRVLRRDALQASVFPSNDFALLQYEHISVKQKYFCCYHCFALQQWQTNCYFVATSYFHTANSRIVFIQISVAVSFIPCAFSFICLFSTCLCTLLFFACVGNVLFLLSL